MRNQLFLVLFFAGFLVFAPWLHAQNAPQEAPNNTVASSLATATLTNLRPTKTLPSDVRVLIDVSGSMKQTDPHNLRKPAMDLIVRLLPDKSRAGVWTFGNTVNVLMPFKPVDAKWRQQAAAKSNSINSIAMHTEIGKALDEASFDQNALSPDYKTHIILLTDGVVDIGKDAVANHKERQRILSEILPNLKSAGYVVHTIALSENSDTSLLKKLSQATDGVYALAYSADQLMDVFLKIFDQAVPAERVPLENNGFLVDASIKEFTALIFRKPGEERTVISSPEGKEYSATNPKDGINWYRTDKYDLITADSPKTGHWQIKTDIAPQSRVTIVSNLQLVFEPLKNNLHSKDVLALTYSFQENGKTISDANFLGLIETNAIVVKNNGEENINTSFTLPIPPADGFFHQSLNVFDAIADYEIHIYVDGKTFKREFKHSLNVRDSHMVLEKNSVVAEDGKLTYSYKISADEKIVDLPQTKVTVSIKNSQNNTVEKSLNLIDGKRWEFSFSPVQEGDYSVDIHALGELLDGEKLDEVLHADNFSYGAKKSGASSSVITALADPKVKNSKVERPNVEKSTSEVKSDNLILYIVFGIGNLLLLVLGYFIYKFIMGGKAKDELAELERTLSTADAQKTSAKQAPGKTEIDLSDDDSAHIPMNDDSSLDSLFPLDSMEDPNGPDDRN